MPCNGQCFTVIQIHNLEEIIVMKYIESLREGERINEIYLCKTKQSALTKAGKPYENVILQDKTGILDAKIWDPGSVGIDDFDSLDYVAVMGDITSFQGIYSSPSSVSEKCRKGSMIRRIIFRSARKILMKCMRNCAVLSVR